jgi:hypothetical protein
MALRANRRGTRAGYKTSNNIIIIMSAFLPHTTPTDLSLQIEINFNCGVNDFIVLLSQVQRLSLARWLTCGRENCQCAKVDKFQSLRDKKRKKEGERNCKLWHFFLRSHPKVVCYFK